jgi:predicted adenylyl cyclase CyaB
MAIEVELKFPVGSFDNVLERLAEMGISPGNPIAEENLIFDTRDRALGQKGILLRLRRTSRDTLITVKTPVDVRSTMKVREEYEASVVSNSMEEAAAMIGALGYEVVAKYKKTRSTCRLDSVRVCLDTLKIGFFVELEGTSEGQVKRVAGKLDLNMNSALTDSYVALTSPSGSRDRF